MQAVVMEQITIEVTGNFHFHFHFHFGAIDLSKTAFVKPKKRARAEPVQSLYRANIHAFTAKTVGKVHCIVQIKFTSQGQGAYTAQSKGLVHPLVLMAEDVASVQDRFLPSVSCCSLPRSPPFNGYELPPWVHGAIISLPKRIPMSV